MLPSPPLNPANPLIPLTQMVAFLGFVAQHAATGKAPLEALSAHIGNPWGANFATNGESQSPTPSPPSPLFAWKQRSSKNARKRHAGTLMLSCQLQRGLALPAPASPHSCHAHPHAPSFAAAPRRRVPALLSAWRVCERRGQGLRVCVCVTIDPLRQAGREKSRACRCRTASPAAASTDRAPAQWRCERCRSGQHRAHRCHGPRLSGERSSAQPPGGGWARGGGGGPHGAGWGMANQDLDRKAPPPSGRQGPARRAPRPVDRPLTERAPVRPRARPAPAAASTVPAFGQLSGKVCGFAGCRRADKRNALSITAAQPRV